MIIYTPILAGQPTQAQQAIPYSEVHHIERANGVTFLKRKSVIGMVKIAETLTAIKNQSQRNDMILVTRYTTTTGTATTQFLLPMQRIKQMTVADGNRTKITFNDEDNPIEVLETLAQIQASTGATLPTGDNFINGVSYPTESQISLSYSLGGSPLLVDLPVANYANTWFVDAERGDDSTALRGSFTKPYQNIENAISAAADYYASQGGSVRQNVIAFAGYYKIEDTVNSGTNFLVRDGVDTHCHAGVVIRYLNTDPNQCTNPFYDKGGLVISNFTGQAKIERYADNSDGTLTVTNSGSQIRVELDVYLGSAMQVREGAAFWFKCRAYENPFASAITTLFVNNSAYCDIRFKANQVIAYATSSYCFLVDSAIDCKINVDVDEMVVQLLSTQIQVAINYIINSVIDGSNFRIGQMIQADFGSYPTSFLIVDSSVINASKCVCDDYNEFCGAFFEISDNVTCNNFLVKITGKATGQKIPSRIYSNQRVTFDLNVEIIDSDTIDLVDFVINCHNGNKDIKPRIKGTIKANNVSPTGHVLFTADLVNYPTQNALASLCYLAIKTNYTTITTDFASNINVPCLSLISNRVFGTNTTAVISSLILSDALAL